MSIPNPLRHSSLNTPGQQIDIDCSHAGVDRDDLFIGLSWDFYPGTTPVDLDASAVCFDNLGVVQDAVYYNQLTAFNGALTHSGDSTDGAGDGFDESIAFDVDKLPNSVHIIAIVVNAHDEGSNFTDVESANCTLQDFPTSTNDEFTKEGKPRTIANISIGCKGKNTGVVLCLLIRNGDPRKWTVKAAGELCPSGRNFNECMPSIRKCVDANLESWVKEERTLSLEKTFDMQKGDNAVLPNTLSKVCIGLGWDCDSSVDLDASVIVMVGGKKIDCCSFMDKNKAAWGLQHQGDNTTGDGDGDDETINIDLVQAAKKGGIGTSLIVTVNIFSYGKSFSSSVKNAYVRIFSPEGDQTLAKYVLSEGAVTTRGLLFAELFQRDRDGWVLKALGIGCGGGSAGEISADELLNISLQDHQKIIPIVKATRPNATELKPELEQDVAKVVGGGGCCVVQ